MLTRLKVENFRGLVNFEIRFAQLNLLLGSNGSGKSTLFDIIFALRHLIIDNARVDNVFRSTDLTAWLDRSDHRFELDVTSPHGVLTYTLHVAYNRKEGKERIEEETLLLNKKPLFSFVTGEVQLYHDDHVPGPTYSFDWSVSALATVAPRQDNTKLTWFKEWIQSVLVVTLQPRAMGAISESDADWLNRDGTNFASWYQYLSQEHQDKTIVLTEILRNTIPGFYAFKLEKTGRHRVLKTGFTGQARNGDPVYFDFDQISDGQRTLIVLYSIAIAARELGYTPFLDEPENFVSLDEIQPWLMMVNDIVEDSIAQFVMISHHPELIDYFGYDRSIWLEQAPLSAVRIGSIPSRLDDGLKMSEQIARGWTER
jgi:predicted ATPase